MSRFLFTILGAIVLIQCGPSEPASKKVTVPFLEGFKTLYLRYCADFRYAV